MANNTQTNVVVSAQAKGFQQAQQAATKFTTAMHQGITKIPIAKFKKEMHEMEHKLQSIAKKQLALNDAMKGMSKGSAELKKATDELKKLEHQATSTEKRISLLTKAFGSEKAAALKHAHGGFTQGVLGGFIGPEAHQMLERGPGVWAQAGGHVVGHSLRHMLGGLASTPMHGIAGLGHALSAIPGGGAVGGLLGEAGQLAMGSIENLKKRQELLPFLSGINGRTVSPFRFSEEQIQNQGHAVYSEMMNRGPQARYGAAAEGTLNVETTAPSIETAEQLEDRARKAAFEENKRLKALNARPDMNFMTMQGSRFGMSKMEAEEFAGHVVQAGGGRGGELETQGMLQAALGAKRAYGVSEEVSGAFLQGGRRGGFGAMRGEGGEQLASSIAAALKGGLEGSEVTDFLKEIADGIQSWKSTGIPIESTSVMELAKSVSSMGNMDVSRGLSVSRDIRNMGQRMGEAGPETGLDFLAAKHLYGYTGGGGAEETLRFMKETEKSGAGGIKENGIENLFQALQERGGGGAMSVITAKSALKKAGVKITAGEIEEMFKLMNAKKSGTLTQEQEDRMKEIQGGFTRGTEEANQIGNVEGLARTGAAKTSHVLKGVADLENQKDIIGQKMIPAIHAFEKASLNMVQAVTQTLKPAVDGIAESAEHFSHWVIELSKKLPWVEGGNGHVQSGHH